MPDNLLEKDKQIWMLAYWYMHESKDMNNPVKETMDIWKIDYETAIKVKELSKEIEYVIEDAKIK